MSASERLRALDAPLPSNLGEWGDEVRRRGAVFLDALPELIAVVELSAEPGNELWTVQDGDEGIPYVSQAGLAYLRGWMTRMDAALAALDKKLGGAE